MKNKLFLIVALLVMISFSLSSQSSLKNTFYLSPVVTMPTEDFGYPKNVNSTSLNAFGAGFNFGMLFYFKEEDEASLLNYGVDLTIGEFTINRNSIVLPENSYYSFSRNDPNLSSTILSMKIGPVMTIVPQDKVGIDVYAQGVLGLSSFDFYNNINNEIDRSPSLTPQYRVASGLRFGYHFIYLNFEYNWGQPVVRKASGSSVPGEEVNEFTIDQSFFKLGATFKFNAF